MVQWWLDWKRFNSLPYGGSDVLAQPHFVVEVIKVCEDTIAEIQEKRRAKSEAEQERMLREMRRKVRR